MRNLTEIRNCVSIASRMSRDHPLPARDANKQQGSEQLVYLPACSRCGKRRRPRTHKDAIEPLNQIICRRPECERLKGLIKNMSKPGNFIIKVNHYHYGKFIPETVPQNKVTELPGDS